MSENISNIGKLKRKAIVDKAINSVALEGLVVSQEQQDNFTKFINGEITAEILNEITRETYGTEN